MPQIEIRLFNSLARYQRSVCSSDSPSTVGEVLDRLLIPEREIYLVLLNGRNIMHSLGGGIEKHHLLWSGDVLALSGPVPFSWFVSTILVALPWRPPRQRLPPVYNVAVL